MKKFMFSILCLMFTLSSVFATNVLALKELELSQTQLERLEIAVPSNTDYKCGCDESA
ncbi:MAG: hypothetical protein HC908_10890 [Calothrix sp. SM1_7_51]|nr:hypothetical protein [Calothrix sp. SM1_7_51]